MSQGASSARSTRSGKSTQQKSCGGVQPTLPQIFYDAKNTASKTSLKDNKSMEKPTSPKGKQMDNTSQEVALASSSQQAAGKNNSLPSSLNTTPTPSSLTLNDTQIHFTITITITI